jgi:methylmalonyl-CoA mutase C-terminal domain/subunit
MTTDPKIRCLLAMLGTDVHTKGIRTLARLLRDQGVEVIYLGEHNTVAGVVSAIIQEDADVVGLSFSSAAYLSYTQQLTTAMRERGIGDVPVMIGGQIHPDDRAKLAEIGVSGIFGPGSTIPEIMSYLERVASPRADGA